MVKLSEKQIEALSEIYDADGRQLHDDYCVGYRRSLQWLYVNDYVGNVRYANGEFWTMTDKGLEWVEEYLKDK